MIWLILFLTIMFYITWRWSYKLLVLILASLNVDAKFDRTHRTVLLRSACYDKLWADVVKELGLEEHK